MRFVLSFLCFSFFYLDDSSNSIEGLFYDNMVKKLFFTKVNEAKEDVERKGEVNYMADVYSTKPRLMVISKDFSNVIRGINYDGCSEWVFQFLFVFGQRLAEDL